MKRRTYIVSITDKATMLELATTTTSAWNSGIRASEALVREYARNLGYIFTGSKPKVIGGMEDPDRQYMRTWTSNGREIIASVWESK